MDQSPRCAVSRGKRLSVVLLTRTLLGILQRSDLAAASFVAAQHVDVKEAKKSGRAGGIRTHGLCVQNAALYQAEPQPVTKRLLHGAGRDERKVEHRAIFDPTVGRRGTRSETFGQ